MINFRKIYTCCLILLSANLLFANDSLIQQAEYYILKGHYDSVQTVLTGKDKDVEYITDMLQQVKSSQSKLNFLQKVESRIKVDHDLIDEFLSKNLTEPKDLDKIDSLYLELRFKQVSSLRNSNKIEQANGINEELGIYIQQFNEDDVRVRRAKLYLDIHALVVYTIQNRGEEAEKVGLKILKEAQTLADTTLMIKANYHLFTAYKIKRDLEKSIEVSENARRLDEARSFRSNLYYDNLFLLLDVYMYKGGYEEEVSKLIRIVYDNEKSRPKSYELIARYFRKILNNPEEQRSILEVVGVKNIVEFTEKAMKETEGIIYDNDQYHFYNACAYTLHEYKEHKLALNVLMKAVFQTRKIYSEDLSKSLADFETKQIRKETEQEVQHEKEQTKLYLLMALLVGILFAVSIVALIRNRKKTSLLAEKNEQIETTLREKQLLLKEVHHRVKNNFQIISSLLELQSRGIEDERAKELAQEGRNRVKSMALIHQRLYQNDDLLIYFDDYIDKLVKEISAMYGAENKASISIQVPKIAFDIDTAIPLGLIVNELVTNAFKYGNGEFENKMSISIQEEKEGGYCLEVKDNGKGMPANFEVEKAKSLGLRLIKSLSKQLHGNVSYINDSGAVFKVFFKNTIERGLVD